MYTLYHCVELAAVTYLLCLCVGNTKSEVEKSFLHKQCIQLGFVQEHIHCGTVGSMSGG